MHLIDRGPEDPLLDLEAGLETSVLGCGSGLRERELLFFQNREEEVFRTACERHARVGHHLHDRFAEGERLDLFSERLPDDVRQGEDVADRGQRRDGGEALHAHGERLHVLRLFFAREEGPGLGGVALGLGDGGLG